MDNNISVGFNHKDNSWTILAYARTAAASSAVLPYPVSFDKYGNVYQQGIGSYAASGEGIPLELVPTVELQLGWGEGGWGQGGWGGWWSPNG